jgi:amidophosphoribosyltransferase
LQLHPTDDPNQQKTNFVLEAGTNTMNLLEGAYSCITLVKGVGLVAFRDPHGIRPLVIGKRPSADASGIEWAIASEDCAFGPIAFERVRDVQPGEMVIITPEGQLISKQVGGV